MKEVRFSEEKNQILKEQRGVNFSDVVEIIENDKYYKIIDHTNKKKYPNQRMFLIKLKGHVYAVPFVEEDDYIFLKTLYPSEKYTKKLLKIKS